jgi:hypothetical protein
MASELFGAVGLVEVALGLLILPLQELWCVRAMPVSQLIPTPT